MRKRLMMRLDDWYSVPLVGFVCMLAVLIGNSDINTGAPSWTRYFAPIGLALAAATVALIAYQHEWTISWVAAAGCVIIGIAFEWYPYFGGLHLSRACYALGAMTTTVAVIGKNSDWYDSVHPENRGKRLLRVLVCSILFGVPGIIVVYGFDTGFGWALGIGVGLAVAAIFVRLSAPRRREPAPPARSSLPRYGND